MIIGNAMPAVVSSLFVLGAMPSGLTDLLLIFLISLTIRSGKTQRESQLFTVICMIFLVHQIMITVAAVIGSPPVILRLLRMSHTMVLFLLPVSVHFMHQTLKLPHKKKAVPAMYGVSLFLLAFVFTDHYMTMKNGFPSAGPLFHVFILISVVCLVVYGVIVLNFVRKTGHPNHTKSLYIFFGLGPTLLLTLWDSLPMFGIPAIFMGGFVFIPMGIYTYGILRHGILDNHGWFSMGYIPNFLTALVWLPLVMTVVLFAATRETLFYPDIVGRIYPMGIPAMISVLICFGLAIYSFQEGTRKMHTMVFGGMCAIWGLLNLDMLLVMLVKDHDVALRISRFDHFFLVLQLGFITHLFYFFTGLRKWVVYLAYAISAVFVPLTQTDYYLTGMHSYSWGFFGARGILFDVLIGIVTVMSVLGSVALGRKILSKDTDKDTRTWYVFFLLGVQFMGLFGLSNYPVMSGVDVFPTGTCMFIPVLLMAYGVFKYDMIKISAYSKRRIWDGAAIILTYVGYGFLAVIAFTILRPIPMQVVAGQWIGTGIPLIFSLAVSVFFSVLSLRVGPSLTGSRLFGLICLIYAFLSSDILLNGMAPDPETALRISRLLHLPMVMAPALYAHLMVVVCRKKRVMPFVRLCYGIGICFVVLTQTPWYLSTAKQYPWGFMAQGGPVFYGFFLFGVLVFNFNAFVFHTSYWRFSHWERRQLLLFSLGLAFSAFFAAGNIPAMSGFDFTPIGNYMYIPLVLFGYAMFRKNIKDVLLLLSQSLYAIGLLVFLGFGSYMIHKIGASPFAWGTVLGGIVCASILFRSFEKVLSTVLALFFGRQKEVLDQLYVRFTDQLSKSRSLDDVVHFTGEPMFRVLQVKTLRFLFYSRDDDIYLVFRRSHPDTEPANPETTNRDRFSPDHPLFALFQTERRVISQARVEAWIAETDTALVADDMLRRADIIQPVYFEDTLTCLLLFQGKVDGSVYSKVEQEFISRIGLMLGPYIENAQLLQGLEKQIESRTEDLRAALQVKSDFLARMSHEVRSPLNAILGMGELLTETPLTDEQARYIDILSNSSGLLLSVINDILDFSKLDSGRVTVESISFDLFRLMNDLKDIAAASSSKKGLDVKLAMGPNLSRHVTGDPYKLAQVIINLADNAVRFTDKGTITFHVNQDPDSRVRFCVEDTGMGIPKDKLSMIFERFSQAESSTTRRYGGSGLGLTISKKLVEFLGGTLSVTSEPGVGSRFEFTASLPASRSSEVREQPPLNTSMFRIKSLFDDVSSAEEEDSPGWESPLKVLLAEDMKTNIQVIRHYFKDCPVSLDVAMDGEQAVGLFQNKSYDLVLMDIHMPRMDGYEAVKKIRSLEREKGNGRTPVIALTAHRPDETRKKQLEDFDAFLMKPIGKKDLVSIVCRLTSESGPMALPEPLPDLPPDQGLSAIIPELVREINEELPTIRDSLARGDYDTASRLSHGFKGAAGNCGLDELSDLFKTLYELISSRVHDRAEAMVPVIRNYVNALK